MIRTGSKSCLTIAPELASGGDNNANLAQARVAAQRATNLETVGARHQQVQQDHGGLVGPGKFNARIAVLSEKHLPPILRKQFLHDLQIHGVVIYYQDLAHGAGRVIVEA